MDRAQAIAQLESVLCDPSGKCCIHGSDADRQQVDLALTALRSGGGEGLTEDDVEWVVNDTAELGVRIHGQCFFLYKGNSLVYETAKHDDGSQMYVRTVGKREFGECCHPINHDDYSKKGTVSLGDSDRWEPMLPALPHPQPASDSAAQPKASTGPLGIPDVISYMARQASSPQPARGEAVAPVPCDCGHDFVECFGTNDRAWYVGCKPCSRAGRRDHAEAKTRDEAVAKWNAMMAPPAAQPAEAGKVRGLVQKWREDADREANDTDMMLRDGAAEQAGVAIGLSRAADELEAALAEQARADTP